MSQDDTNNENVLEEQGAQAPELTAEEEEERRLQLQKMRFDNLMEARREAFPDFQSQKSGLLDGPFGRMLFSIPVFILFWLFYWRFLR